MPDLPSGEVTLLFTDIEGSTMLLESVGSEAYADALAEHRRILRRAADDEGGVEVDTQGDAFLIAFADANAAVRAAEIAQRKLANGPVRVRMGLHTGYPQLTDEGYVGQELHLGARVAGAAHGGQVLLSWATHEAVVGVACTDLGEHRLKDFVTPVWIYQLGSERFPPLRTVAATNLPNPPSSFIGRETDLAAVGRMVQDGIRLVTLTGPGGSGKTRLAIETAATLIPLFPNGVYWVDLAPVRDHTLVVTTIGNAIGARGSLAQHIGRRRMLLVLDNLEHVVDCAPQLSALLGSCGDLQMMVTSRELLRVQGEREFAVGPMVARDAVELFETRTGLPADDAATELCARLDYLPLAVELAAARADILSSSQMLDRLGLRLDELTGGRDADPRHKTLRAAIDWSFDLLSGDERALVARLSIFRGGWTLDAALVICAAAIGDMQQLVEKSLVHRDDGRFSMLETIREYSAERLSAADASTSERTHAEFYLALAKNVRAAAMQDPAAYVQLERDYDNVRGALAWCVRDGDRGQALDTLWSLWHFWLTRGHVREGDRWAQQLLDVEGTEESGRETRGLSEASELARFAGEPRRAAGLKVAALERGGDDDPELRANTARDLALVLLGMGDVDGARAYADEALDIQGRLNVPGGVAHALFGVAEVAWRRGERTRAVELMKQSADGWAEAGERAQQASSLEQLACFERQSGNLKQARELLEQALAQAEESRDDFGVLWCLRAFGAQLADEGHTALAVQVWAATHALATETGLSFEELPADHEIKVAQVRSIVDSGEFERLWHLGATMTEKEAAQLALSVEH